MKKTTIIDMPNKMNGFMHLYHLRSDLMFKYAEISVTETVETKKSVFVPGLRLIILLEGRMEINFDSKVFALDATLKPQAAFLYLNKSEIGNKIFRKDQLQKELVMFLDPKWIMESQLNLSGYHQFKHNLKPYPIVPMQSMLRLINYILAEENEPAEFVMLEREGILLEVLANAFSQLTQAPQFRKDRVQQLMEALDSGKFDGWSLKKIAKYFHTNVTTLQNEFKQYNKMPIFAYLRRTKLEQSYKLLLNGSSVTQAAEFAGYANSENFSTAFKKNFGTTPSQVKKSNKGKR